MTKNRISQILQLDRSTLVSERNRVEDLLKTPLTDPARYDDLLREYSVLEGAIEINEGVQEPNLTCHPLMEMLTFSAGDSSSPE